MKVNTVSACVNFKIRQKYDRGFFFGSVIILGKVEDLWSVSNSAH